MQPQSGAPFSPFFRFTEQSGEQLFANVCQGCHMGDAKGAENVESPGDRVVRNLLTEISAQVLDLKKRDRKTEAESEA